MQQQQQILQKGIETAKGFEAIYDWQKAHQAYQEVIDSGPENQEAAEGLVRTGRLIRAVLSYRHALRAARQHADAGEFQKAIKSFNTAMTAKPSYLPMAAKTRRLQDTLKKQSVPIEITFRSDGKTYVRITGFRKLGRIKEETASFLPGNYIVRGNRKGYREVILEVRVRNGRILDPIDVICREKI